MVIELSEWCVISKSNESAAQVRFVIISMILDQNCTTLDSTTTLLHPFWNRLNIGLSQFKYFIDAVLSRFEIKFIHFLGGKNKSFGYDSCKICHIILFVFHFSPIWLATLDTPWNLIGFFLYSILVGSEKDAIWSKKWCDLEPIRLQGPPVISKWL